VNLDHLRELDELFEYRGDALILLCLAHAGRPLRFRELARTIVEQSGSYIADGKISRSLPRLKQCGLVIVGDEDNRHPSYRPTPLGQAKAGLLTFVLESMEHRHHQPPKRPNESDKPDGP
jgi:DNA-binding HxlR family transcriptional regulator